MSSIIKENFLKSDKISNNFYCKYKIIMVILFQREVYTYLREKNMEEENKKAEEAAVSKETTEEKIEKKEEKPKKKNTKNSKTELEKEVKEKNKKSEQNPKKKSTKKEEKVELGKKEDAKQIIQEVVEIIEEKKDIPLEKDNKQEIDKDKDKKQEEKKENAENQKVETENVEKDSQQFVQVENKIKSKKKGVIITLSIAIIFIIVAVFSIIFALMNISSQKILNGISILGIDVSDLTVEEARQRINDAINQKFSNAKDGIVLKHGDSEVSVNANTFNAKFDVDSAVTKAYNVGRGGNIVTNNYEILWTRIFQREIESELHWDEEFMKTTIDDINAKMKDAVVEYSYYIENKKLIVVRGKEGYVIQKEQLQNQIIEQLKNIHNPYQEIEIPVQKRKPSEIDLEKIRNEIYKEPKDAYVERNPTKVHVEENVAS